MWGEYYLKGFRKFLKQYLIFKQRFKYIGFLRDFDLEVVDKV